MLELIVTNKFKKDLKRIRKQGKDLDLLQDVLQTLLEENELDVKHRDHALTGNYIGFRECHIEPDWLLIYMINHSACPVGSICARKACSLRQ